jgi:hypothetical protein
MSSLPFPDEPFGPLRRVVLLLGLLYLIAVSAAFTIALNMNEKYWPVQSDQAGYYAYLTASLRSDGFDFHYIHEEPWPLFHSRGTTYFPLVKSTGKRVNQFTPGIAILHAPLFYTALGVSYVTGIEINGGYGPLCRFASMLSGVMYATLGLFFIALALHRRFENRTVIWTIPIIGIGTHFSHYASVENLMTHIHSFFALSVVLWATLQWEHRPSVKFALIGGLALGIASLIRPLNVIFCVIPVYFLARPAIQVEALTKLKHVLLAAAMSVIGVAPLLIYWKYAMGSVFKNPYGPDMFYWGDPAFSEVLFSYRKGWLLYTPAIVLMLGGLFVLPKYIKGLSLPLAVYVFLCLYWVGSWWAWWAGGAFGQRYMLESMAGGSLAFAAAIQLLLQSTFNRVAKVFFLLLISFNLFQNYQYIRLYIPDGGVTKEIYWRVFLRPHIPDVEVKEIHKSVDSGFPRYPNVENWREHPYFHDSVLD